MSVSTLQDPEVIEINLDTAEPFRRDRQPLPVQAFSFNVVAGEGTEHPMRGGCALGGVSSAVMRLTGQKDWQPIFPARLIIPCPEGPLVVENDSPKALVTRFRFWMDGREVTDRFLSVTYTYDAETNEAHGELALYNLNYQAPSPVERFPLIEKVE